MQRRAARPKSPHVQHSDGPELSVPKSPQVQPGDDPDLESGADRASWSLKEMKRPLTGTVMTRDLVFLGAESHSPSSLHHVLLFTSLWLPSRSVEPTACGLLPHRTHWWLNRPRVTLSHGVHPQREGQDTEREEVSLTSGYRPTTLKKY